MSPEEHDPDTSDDQPSQRITRDYGPEYYVSALWNEKVDTYFKA